jgi:hypothetical protein
MIRKKIKQVSDFIENLLPIQFGLISGGLCCVAMGLLFEQRDIAIVSLLLPFMAGLVIQVLQQK